MGTILRYALLLAKRWIWMLVAGALVCGATTYGISTLLRPVYQASTYLIITIGSSTHPSITESLQAVPTFAQLITTPSVLAPVVALHPGMSVQDLQAMLTIKPQTNTQIIELDVRADNPSLAAELANQVSQSFAQYVNTDAPGTVRFMPSQMPVQPVQPRPLENAGIGTVVGLLLMILLSLFFEWIRNCPTSVEQIQELLDTEIITLLPRLPRKAYLSGTWQATAEKYHMVCASLNVAQASRPFKVVIFTSALAGEGKSTVISQVAMNLAQAGKRVLLVDLNIHRPVLAQRFRLPSQPGLTNLLASDIGEGLHLEQYSQASEVSGLHVLTVGTQRMNSAEFLQALITSQFLACLRQTTFDYILLDAPPLFSVADSQILLPALEAVVLVVNGARTPRRVLARTRQVLGRLRTTRVLGVIINQSPWRDYADMHPYTLPQPGKQREMHFLIKQGAVDLSSQPTQLLPVPALVTGSRQARLPDNQWIERVSGPLRLRLPGNQEDERAGNLLQPQWRDTGEIGSVTPEEAAAYVIRPMLSLNGLHLPDRGLTRRGFEAEIVTPPPPFLQDR